MSILTKTLSVVLVAWCMWAMLVTAQHQAYDQVRQERSKAWMTCMGADYYDGKAVLCGEIADKITNYHVRTALVQYDRRFTSMLRFIGNNL